MKSKNLKFFLFLMFLCFVGCLPPPSTGTGAGSAAAPGSTDFASFIFQTVSFFLLIFFVYFFLVVRPSVLKEDTQKKFFDGLKKNAEVMTTGGLFGRVVSISDDFITLEIARDTKIKVHPQYVTYPPATKNPADKSGSAKPSAEELPK